MITVAGDGMFSSAFSHKTANAGRLVGTKITTADEGFTGDRKHLQIPTMALETFLSTWR